jgi:transcriptional regulator with XRE-family HTH domain
MPTKPVSITPEDIRRIRRSLDETQAAFAKRLDVDQVTVARWETGQRRCSGSYAAAILRLDSPPRRVASPAPRDEATFSALAHLVRAFFDGSTTRAVSALLSREKLSKQDLDALARLIEKKKGEEQG